MHDNNASADLLLIASVSRRRLDVLPSGTRTYDLPELQGYCCDVHVQTLTKCQPRIGIAGKLLYVSVAMCPELSLNGAGGPLHSLLYVHKRTVCAALAEADAATAPAHRQDVRGSTA